MSSVVFGAYFENSLELKLDTYLVWVSFSLYVTSLSYFLASKNSLLATLKLSVASPAFAIPMMIKSG